LQSLQLKGRQMSLRSFWALHVYDATGVSTFNIIGQYANELLMISQFAVRFIHLTQSHISL